MQPTTYNAQLYDGCDYLGNEVQAITIPNKNDLTILNKSDPILRITNIPTHLLASKTHPTPVTVSSGLINKIYQLHQEQEEAEDKHKALFKEWKAMQKNIIALIQPLFDATVNSASERNCTVSMHSVEKNGKSAEFIKYKDLYIFKASLKQSQKIVDGICCENKHLNPDGTCKGMEQRKISVHLLKQIVDLNNAAGKIEAQLQGNSEEITKQIDALIPQLFAPFRSNIIASSAARKVNK